MAYDQYEPRKHTGLSAAGTEMGEGAKEGFKGALRGGLGGTLLGAVLIGAAIPATISLFTTLSVAAFLVPTVLIGAVSLATPFPYMVGGALALAGGGLGVLGGMDKGGRQVRGEELAMRREMAHDAEISVYNNMAQARAMEAQAAIVNAQAAMANPQGMPRDQRAEYGRPETEFTAYENMDAGQPLDEAGAARDKPSMMVDAGSIEAASKLAQTPIADMAKA